ncbi:MAG TPA: hypothetical protein VNY05_09885 [Candidatus Acidoferrales bacterium]|jgi:hypothetical protein|nr:hypothetical protein [Candidatus Acidoferrales bacterium]
MFLLRSVLRDMASGCIGSANRWLQVAVTDDNSGSKKSRAVERVDLEVTGAANGLATKMSTNQTPLLLSVDAALWLAGGGRLAVCWPSSTPLQRASRNWGRSANRLPGGRILYGGPGSPICDPPFCLPSCAL